jgi:hypothetical protein
MHAVAWTENALSAGDRTASVAASKEHISEPLRESECNRAHVRFGAPQHHVGPTKRKGGAREPQRPASDGCSGCDDLERSLPVCRSN